MKIRKAGEKDIKEVQKIADIPALRTTGENHAPSERWLKAFIDEKQIFLVAEVDKKVVGFIFGERTTGDVGYLWEIGVNENFRSNGIGKELLEAFANECEKRKLRSIITYGHLNEKTLKFFKKSKFYEGEVCKELKRKPVK